MTDGRQPSSMPTDRALILDLIPDGARVLDLGCGDGALLAELIACKGVLGRGVDIDRDNIIRCLERGLSVCQCDIDSGLAGYPDDAYDFVILNQTLQVIRRPDNVIREMLRIGKYCVVGFPNFGHWKVRLSILASGRMPVTEALPYMWYDTPNIRELTIADFRALCRAQNIDIVREYYHAFGSWRTAGMRATANMLATHGLFVLRGGT